MAVFASANQFDAVLDAMDGVAAIVAARAPLLVARWDADTVLVSQFDDVIVEDIAWFESGFDVSFCAFKINECLIQPDRNLTEE
jgi:hypothetical protein